MEHSTLNFNPNFVVATPVFAENKSLIERNIESVQSQASSFVKIEHILCQDGVSNLAKRLLRRNAESVQWMQCRYNHSDYGDYVRRLGTRIANFRKARQSLFLDADNYWSEEHLHKVIKVHEQKRKNIVISNRVLLTDLENYSWAGKFFDTNTITLFNEHKTIGLNWGIYPRELSIIGDRIMSHYIKKHFQNEIAYTDAATIFYRHGKISMEKIQSFKFWYEKNYHYTLIVW